MAKSKFVLFEFKQASDGVQIIWEYHKQTINAKKFLSWIDFHPGSTQNNSHFSK